VIRLSASQRISPFSRRAEVLAALGLTLPGLSRILPWSLESDYERARYRDLTTNLGGPVARERLLCFTGYQYLRDYDSQPGTLRDSRGRRIDRPDWSAVNLTRLNCRSINEVARINACSALRRTWRW
jgi:hypothetical protein